MKAITDQYERQTKAALKAVEEIFEIARFSQGVEITISLAIDEVPQISYAIKGATILTE
jgi:hypothetical protein